MAKYNPRNRNERTREAPKATAEWFDDQAERRRDKPTTCGFAVPETERCA